MSTHDKMNADYVWIRNAPVEEGLKVRYYIFLFKEITAFISCTIELLIESKDYKWSTGISLFIVRSIGKQYDW